METTNSQAIARRRVQLEADFGHLFRWDATGDTHSYRCDCGAVLWLTYAGVRAPERIIGSTTNQAATARCTAKDKEEKEARTMATTTAHETIINTSIDRDGTAYLVDIPHVWLQRLGWSEWQDVTLRLDDSRVVIERRLDDATHETMAQMADAARPDSIDWMRDGDTRHFYDDVLPLSGDTEPY